MLGQAQPLAWVVELLIGRAVFRIDLVLEGLGVLFGVGAHSRCKGELGVGVDVHLEDAIVDGGFDLILFRTRATVEDQIQGVRPTANPFSHQGLGIFQDLRAQLHIARFIDPVHVAEGSGDAEVADGGEQPVGFQHVFGLGVEVGVVGDVVVRADAVFLAAGDAQLDLQAHAQRLEALQDRRAGREVVGQGFFREVQHVRGKERPAGGLVVALAFFDHALDPGDQLAVGVVGVKHHADAVVAGQQVHVLGGRDSAQHPCAIAPGKALPGKELGAAVGELNDHVRAVPRRGLEHGVHRIGPHHVDRRKGVMIFFTVA